MSIKMPKTSQLSTIESKDKTKTKNKLSKQPEQEYNHRFGDHLEGYQLGGGKGRLGKMVQGSRSIMGKNKIDKEMLRIV